MVLESLKNKTINVPALGAVPFVAVGAGLLVLWLALRRKKSIGLKF